MLNGIIDLLIPDNGYRRTLSDGLSVVELVSADDSLLALTLAEVCPFFPVVTRTPDLRLVVASDEKAMDVLRGVESAMHDAFVSYRGPGGHNERYRYFGAKLVDGAMFRIEDGPEVLYCIRVGTTVALVLRSSVLAVTWTVRILRELLNKRAEDRGAIHVHASAFEVAGNGVICVGAKGTGKTTVMCAMLQEYGARYIANDRATIWSTPNGIFVRGQPLSVRIAPRTIDQSERLRTALASGLVTRFDRAKHTMLASEFIRACRTTVTTRSTLRIVLFPSVGDDDCLIKIADGAESEQRFAESVYTPVDPGFPDWLGIRTSSDADLKRRATQLTSQVFIDIPSYIVRMNVGVDTEAINRLCTVADIQ
jgi:hypothetical protein